MALSGDLLFDIVAEYSALGIHRSGSTVDRGTIQWMGEQLAQRGLTIDPRPEPFDRYVASSRLTVDGIEIDHLPVFYEWTGSIDTNNLWIREFDGKGGGYTLSLTELTQSARAEGADAVVLANQHPEGALVAVNLRAEHGSGIPTVLVAGRDLDRLRAGNARLEMQASLTTGHTTNLVATNDLPGPPLLLTTPLTGWFTCAGERGTGVAVLIDLVERCSHLPLLVLATGGHELDYFGVRRWVEANDIMPNAIVHVGASAAVDALGSGGVRELISTRIALTSLSPDEAQPLTDALEPIGLDLQTSTERWLGESEVFCEVGVPMLSFTGSGIDFHTPEDTPERATSPRSLARVAKAIGTATLNLDQMVRSGR